MSLIKKIVIYTLLFSITTQLICDDSWWSYFTNWNSSAIANATRSTEAWIKENPKTTLAIGGGLTAAGVACYLYKNKNACQAKGQWELVQQYLLDHHISDITGLELWQKLQDDPRFNNDDDASNLENILSEKITEIRRIKAEEKEIECERKLTQERDVAESWRRVHEHDQRQKETYEQQTKRAKEDYNYQFIIYNLLQELHYDNLSEYEKPNLFRLPSKHQRGNIILLLDAARALNIDKISHLANNIKKMLKNKSHHDDPYRDSHRLLNEIIKLRNPQFKPDEEDIKEPEGAQAEEASKAEGKEEEE